MRVVQRVRLWLEAEGPGTTRPKQGWPVAVSECGREIYFVHIDSVHIDWSLTVLTSPERRSMCTAISPDAVSFASSWVWPTGMGATPVRLIERECRSV